MQALPNPGGLFLPPDHLQGGYVQQIKVFFTEPVDNSDEIVFHNAPPLGPWPTGMGSLRHSLHLHSTSFDCRKHGLLVVNGKENCQPSDPRYNLIP